MAKVAVPWRPGCRHREAALTWLAARLDVTVGECPDGPWRKGLAVWAAVATVSPDEVLVVHDADVWAPGLPEAIEVVASGAAPWAVPHTHVHRLTEHGTSRVLTGQPFDSQPLDQAPYRGTIGGGVVVLRRALYEEVPIDPRFIGWGQEDESWGRALTAMVGPPWRGKAPLWHLWHPPQQRRSRQVGNLENYALAERYRRARRSRPAMEAILAEVTRLV